MLWPITVHGVYYYSLEWINALGAGAKSLEMELLLVFSDL